ncbi:hypothetical protein FB451DRAFT_1362029 [Mycena latifolia]|nr:hypothetical protein FB451DRAFT_1362029 [Mycena latifolia]
MPDFPQELIDAIIDEVPDSSLPACSLTAAAFVPSSQRRLFRWMSLSKLGAYERTAALLTMSPHLGKYVRYLALEVRDLPKDYPQLKAILAVLTDIERLTIGGQGGRDQFAQNPRLIELLSLPSLRCFGLHHLSAVPSSVVSCAFASFEEVALSYLDIADDEHQGPEKVSLARLSINERDPESEDGLPPFDLWHLIITADQYDAIIAFVLHPKQSPYMKYIERLSIVFPPVLEAHQPRFRQLLTACANTLEHLELELETPLLGLPELPALSSLELWLDIDLVKTPDFFTSIIVQTAACAPHLEFLSLSLLDRPKRLPHRQLQFTRSAAEWPALDAALMDMRDLQEVHVSLRHFVWDSERYAAFVPFIELKLPRAYDAALLSFSPQSAFGHPMDRFALA